MALRSRRVRWLAGTASALAIGGTTLLVGTAAAQTPAPSAPGGPGIAVPVVCRAVVAGPAAGATRSSAGVLVSTDDFVAQLARALGKTPEDVQRAMEQAARELPPPDITTAPRAVLPGPEEHLAPVAARLGVSVEDLLDAVAAASPCPSAPPQTGAVQGLRLDIDTYFEAIAIELGHGITAAQVRSAFEALQPPPDAPRTGTVHISPDGYLDALARALGVTIEQLKAALDSIRPGR